MTSYCRVVGVCVRRDGDGGIARACSAFEGGRGARPLRAFDNDSTSSTAVAVGIGDAWRPIWCQCACQCPRRSRSRADDELWMAARWMGHGGALGERAGPWGWREASPVAGGVRWPGDRERSVRARAP